MIKTRGGQSFNFAIPAGKSVTQPAFGTRAYLIVATGNVNMRVRGKSYGTTAYTEFAQGTGIGEPDSAEQFDYVDINNFNAFPVVVSLWVGFADFIDNRLIIANATTAQIVKPTYDDPGSLATVAIQDISGSPFVDVNGNQWLAISRVAIDVFNLSASDTYFLQNYGATLLPGAGGVAVGSVQPLTPIKFAYGGDFTMQNNGSMIDALISEIYAAIPAT